MAKSTAQIRQLFLDFFNQKSHKIVPSSSLVPHNDPTLLFTNAGMNQFKDVFLGRDKRDYIRATSSQRCVRAGGKHNDLDNVGYTARHHTFFEMLGNFSFGDYFKKEAIYFAWEFLTGKEWLALPAEKLLVTVYENDDEAYTIWTKEIGIYKDRVIRIGDNKGAPYASDNFWQMGETGPCGPCSEIFYDHGEQIWGGPPGSANEDGDRFIEIWNIVFMQFNRQANGELMPLPKPSVDTGMGLERIAAVSQQVNSNYDIDLFRELINRTATILNIKDTENKSLRVITDHIRSCAYLIVDGVLPSNEGRGYVLRRIVRRAVRHGHRLGAKDLFFYRLVQPLIEVMADAGIELKEKQELVENTLKQEESQFVKTLERGLGLLDSELEQLKSSVLPGEIAFKLYDTYGFPFDLTADVCREKEIRIDAEGFEKAMAEQRQRARQSNQFTMDYSKAIKSDKKTEFTGYTKNTTSARIIEIFENGEAVTEISATTQAIIVLDTTPFYGEAGGQLGDTGTFFGDNFQFDIVDTQKYSQSVGHIGTLSKGKLQVGDTITATINTEQRKKTNANHSATHLLHASLREILGPHINQKGSLVSPEYLRFDFSHAESITEKQLLEIENRVNAQIRANHRVDALLMSLEDARKTGAMALFGEKYGDMVRVLFIGEFSIELCSGTHVMHTGDIGLFKLLSESGVAAGIRRIEAVTGQAALTLVQNEVHQINQIAQILKSDRKVVFDKVNQLIEQNKQLEKDLLQLKNQCAAAQSAQLLNNIVKINDKNVLVAEVKGVEGKVMRAMIDEIKNKVKSGVIILATVQAGRIYLAAGVTQDLTATIKAGEIIANLAAQVGGKGGGRSDFARAGGSDIAALPQALSSITETIKEKLM